MLLCDSCTLQPICKYYENICRLLPVVTINDMECAYLPSAQQISPETEISTEDKMEARKALREIQRQELVDSEPKIIKASEENSCTHCKQNNVDLLECSECGALVCGDCAYETPEHKVYCPHCYDNDDSGYVDSSIDWVG